MRKQRGPFTRRVHGVDLTDRQWEFLCLIGEGLDDHAIAKRTGTTWHSARTQIKHLNVKFGLRQTKGLNHRVMLARLAWEAQEAGL